MISEWLFVNIMRSSIKNHVFFCSQLILKTNHSISSLSSMIFLRCSCSTKHCYDMTKPDCICFLGWQSQHWCQGIYLFHYCIWTSRPNKSFWFYIYIYIYIDLFSCISQKLIISLTMRENLFLNRHSLGIHTKVISIN